jgi:hypothetical protein
MEIFAVEGPWPGRLAVCSRPRSGWFLDDDIRALRTAGFDILVSALVADETAKLDLLGVPEVCLAHGIEFVQFPVGNLMVPPIDAALPVLEGWRQSLVDGRGLAVHCWGSVGRSPTLAAALLALGGISPEESWRRIEEARGRDVPDTLEQRRWVAEIALRAGVRSSKGIKATCDG